MTVFLHKEKITLPNGLTGMAIEIPTANPLHFYQAISAPAQVPQTSIHGQLFVPQTTAELPVVMIVPGSLGIADSHIFKAELLTNAVIAAFLVDPFGARGVTSTVANQTQYSFAASAWDVLAAAEVLGSRAEIDASRIGALGHSRGGSAVLSAACMQRVTEFRTSLAAVYAAYPWCGQQFLNPQVGTTHVRSVVGDQDEWCLAQQVQGYMQAMRLAGGDASCRIFAGAHHSFDRSTPVELIDDASVAPAAPTIYIEDSGACIHPATGRSDSSYSERELLLYGIKAGYGRRGARIGTQGDQAQEFNEDMMEYWTRTLG